MVCIPYFSAFLAWYTYNSATTEQLVICQCDKNAHLISSLGPRCYRNHKNYERFQCPLPRCNFYLPRKRSNSPESSFNSYARFHRRRQLQPNSTEFLPLPDSSPVAQNLQAIAFLVLLSGLVPYDGENSAVIRNPIETEVMHLFSNMLSSLS